jgi:hypothetical protein
MSVLDYDGLTPKPCAVQLQEHNQRQLASWASFAVSRSGQAHLP